MSSHLSNFFESEYIVFSNSKIELCESKYYEESCIYVWGNFEKLIKDKILPTLDNKTKREFTTKENIIKKVKAYGPYRDYYHAIMVRDRVIKNIIPSPIIIPQNNNLQPTSVNRAFKLPHFIEISKKTKESRIRHSMFEQI